MFLAAALMAHAVPVVQLPFRFPAVHLLTPMPGATGLLLLPSAALLQVTTRLPLPMPIIARLPVQFPFLKSEAHLFPAAERPFPVTAEITAQLPSRLPAVHLLTPMPGATGLRLLPSAV